MAWAKVDDGWWAHPKVMGLSLPARGLWVSCLSWSCHQRRDTVPRHLLAMVGAEPEHADELVEAGLWRESGDGWVIHDWAEYQEMSTSEKRAEAGRKGGQRSGETRRDRSKTKQPNEATAKQTKQTDEANAEAGPSHPDPSPPNPTEEPTIVEPAPPPSTSLALVAPEPPEPDKPDPVDVVFDAWRTETGHDRAKLTDDRRKRIRRWLKAGYSPEDLADACRGVTLSEFHMGRNDRHTVYDDLSVVLKDSRNIEQFMDLARDGPSAAARPRPKSADTIARFARGGPQ